jgi:curved DNA-binding protein CbpA
MESLWRHTMEASNVVDYYETLEISPNANSGTVERMFRYLAQRYHPDNQDTGDRSRFDAMMEAYDTLKDPAKRAQYDIIHKDHSRVRWKLAEETNGNRGIERDADIQNTVLSILYVRRRQNVSDPGLGGFMLESLVGCPAEHMEFHLWYLKEKGWIRLTDSGMFTITVEGVDRANSELHPKITNKLLTDQRQPASKTNEERRSVDARSGKDRRSGLDTRSDQEKAAVGERRSADRRSGNDRRSQNRNAQETMGRK